MIRWVVQNNLSSESGDFSKIKEACDKLKVKCEGVAIIPFSKDLPEFTKDASENIYYGATTFINNLQKEFNPEGVFFDPKEFSMQNYINIWGDKMLSSEAKITTFDKFSKEDHPDDSLWFIRPDADDKSFEGNVWDFNKIKVWKDNLQKYDNVNLDGDTLILVSPPYNIRKEWRNYVVDGKVVTASKYRENFKLKKCADDIPPEMIQFVEDRCKEYTPHDIFAMDIALCGDEHEYYIIECGCMNSVGLYACDVDKLVEAISEYVTEKQHEKVVHYCYCDMHLEKSGVTIDMLDDLYCGLVGGVLCNFGHGRTPEYMEGIGPSSEERHSLERYEMMFMELTCIVKNEYSLEEFKKDFPKKEWKSILKEYEKYIKKRTENPEETLVSLRMALREKMELRRKLDKKYKNEKFQ